MRGDSAGPAVRTRRGAALIVVTGALVGAFVGLPAAASAAVTDDTTGGSPVYDVPFGPAVPPAGENIQGAEPIPPQNTIHNGPPQQGSSWTVPQPMAHMASTVGAVLSGTVDGVPADGSSWT
jgi:hypothetical protein